MRKYERPIAELVNILIEEDIAVSASTGYGSNPFGALNEDGSISGDNA